MAVIVRDVNVIKTAIAYHPSLLLFAQFSLSVLGLEAGWHDPQITDASVLTTE